jgi:hypothetical protein
MNGSAPSPALHVFTLRELPLAARLTLALFLLSVGIGYVSALVQLHFQHATPGTPLPSRDDAVRIFHGDVGGRPKSKIEQLLPEDYQGKPFNGQGQMTAAFFGQAEDYKSAVKARKKQLAKQAQANPDDEPIARQAEQEVRQKHDTERRIVLAWIEAGASEKEYDDDQFPLPKEWADRPVKKEYLVEEDGKIAEPRSAKIKTILQDRCVRCHQPNGDDPNAAAFPLTNFKQLKPYVTVQTSSGMSLTKLAQTTHVHLLGFSMLYGLTGLILAFSSYPRWLRLLLCPLPLFAQVVDISFWWLARLPEPGGPLFAEAIVVSGAIVAVGLLLHIVLGLFNLFRLKGWLVLILLFAATAYAGHVAKTRVLDPYLAQENAPNAAEK